MLWVQHALYHDVYLYNYVGFICFLFGYLVLNLPYDGRLLVTGLDIIE